MHKLGLLITQVQSLIKRLLLLQLSWLKTRTWQWCGICNPEQQHMLQQICLSRQKQNRAIHDCDTHHLGSLSVVGKFVTVSCCHLCRPCGM